MDNDDKDDDDDATDSIILASIIRNKDDLPKPNDQFLYTNGFSDQFQENIIDNINNNNNNNLLLDLNVLYPNDGDKIQTIFSEASSPSEMSAISTATPPPLFNNCNNAPTPTPSSISATSILTPPYDEKTAVAAIPILEQIPHVSLPEPKRRGPPPGGKRKKLSREEKEQKVQLRMLKNRTAAQESRDKKKNYVEALENENLKLRKQNAELAQRLLKTETEKQSIKAQLELFTTQISQLPTLIPTSNTNAAPFTRSNNNNAPVTSFFSSFILPQTFNTNLAPQSLNSFNQVSPYNFDSHPQVFTTTYSTSSTSTITLADFLGLHNNNDNNNHLSGSPDALKHTTTTKTTTTVTRTTLPVTESKHNNNNTNSSGESWWSWLFESKKPKSSPSACTSGSDAPFPGVYSAKLGPSSTNNEISTPSLKWEDIQTSKIKNLINLNRGISTNQSGLYIIPGIKQRSLMNLGRQQMR